jgi:hypothetical protein
MKMTKKRYDIYGNQEGDIEILMSYPVRRLRKKYHLGHTVSAIHLEIFSVRQLQDLYNKFKVTFSQKGTQCSLLSVSCEFFSAKFGTCTVVSAKGTLFKAKMFTFTLKSTHFIFNKCPIYTHDGASVNIKH